ncbi:molybdopterin-guanine dinucleotide biosynthesis protein B [Paenibacillus sp. sptzw28]|uniref:molybdopterin-guanine dinucleotide biosynthesis protein B n=1 Tax=Paenibacillus sp. sptzw28 TaxID=715179 RepID=UPI001C6DE076|nr:molybdopterin-guanine dinucleotide biosynthesis protein B [Paenibacillus sp. sptzw28]QYR20710.1 molybdopterin-guanine dinucleotide biosynthesis protein B [Paenibacillus sp. sptzw28]
MLTEQNYNRDFPRHQFVLQVVGYKNSGKTTLITSLIQRFKRAGYTVGTVKHDAHDFTMDTPGTDTWKHQAAGADITAISSSNRSAILRSRPESLHSLLEQMGNADIVLVEGFKQEAYPKLILIREPADIKLLRELTSPNGSAAILWPEANTALNATSINPTIKGEDSLLAADPFPSTLDIPHFDISELDSIYAFIHSRIVSAANNK